MTAWGLLVHAQLTHNLKLFLETASRNLLHKTKPQISDWNSDNQNLQNIISNNQNDNISGFESGNKTSVVGGTNDSTTYESAIVEPWNRDKMGSNIVIVSGNGKRVISERLTDQPKGPVNVEGLDVGNSPQKSISPKQSSIFISPVIKSDLSTGKTIDGKMIVLKSVSEVIQPLSLLPTGVSAQLTSLPQTASGGTALVVKNIPVSIPHRTSNIVKPSPSTLPAVVSSSILTPGSHETKASAKVYTSPSEQLIISTEQISPLKSSIRYIETLDTDLGEEAIDPPNSNQNEEQAMDEASSLMAEDTVRNSADSCCNDQGCGVTIIPVSHEDLQKCCNAVVPKKRKRHIEQKHMPFAWGTSRYASRKLLYRSKACNAARAMSSQMFNKQSGGTIYIDVEPESLMFEDDHSQGSSRGAHQTASVRVTQTMDHEGSSNSSESSFHQNSENTKQHSLILKPGAVFSIPFSYNIPKSVAIPVSSERTSTSDNPRKPQSEYTETESSEAANNSGDGEPVSKMVAISSQSQFGTKEMIRTSILARKSSRHHVTSDEDERPKSYSSKPFQCEKCTMTFNQRIHLKKHMSKHTGIYICITVFFLQYIAVNYFIIWKLHSYKICNDLNYLILEFAF